MKGHRSLWVVVLLLVFIPASAESQVQNEPDPTPASVEGEVSPFTAGLLEWLIPTAGFGYAGDWNRGLWPNAVRVGGTVLFFASVFGDSNLLSDDWECGTACNVGLILSAVGGIWAVSGAVSTAKDHNDRLRFASSVVTLAPLPGGGLSVGLKFRR